MILPPRYLEISSGPLTAMKFALEAFATALASKVFPQPGGPYNNTPYAVLILNCLHFSEYRIGNEIASSNSLFKFERAPISCQVTVGTTENPSRCAVGCMIFKADSKSLA